jgi:predicted metal-binding membrane protein
MAAMMLPSAAPTILARVGGERRDEGGGLLHGLLFAALYLAIWTAFALAAALAQSLLALAERILPLGQRAAIAIGALAPSAGACLLLAPDLLAKLALP